jgi:hypothetical protein
MLARGRRKRLFTLRSAGTFLLRQLTDAADQLQPANRFTIGHGVERSTPSRLSTGPSWGREPAVTSGQSRCSVDNQTRSSTAVIGRDGTAGPYGMQEVRGSNPLSSTTTNQGKQPGARIPAGRSTPAKPQSERRQARNLGIRDRRHLARDLRRAIPAAGHAAEGTGVRVCTVPQIDATGRGRATL